MLDEIPEQLEFTSRQIQNLSITSRFGSDEVHVNGSKIKCSGLRHGPAGRTPQQRLDASHQLEHIEWLGDVIIGADFQPVHLIAGLPASRQHQNRSNEPSLANVLANVETTFIGQHHVQNNQIKRNSCGFLESRISVSCAFYRVSFVSQTIAHRHAQRFFAFHEQYVSSHGVFAASTYLHFPLARYY